ncbi:hypothetical protein Bbelb_096430 [Branchiostoma belcheri]|nr:hypothetical protein Bbelb_096430 [Branchiostoma belcheri]
MRPHREVTPGHGSGAQPISVKLCVAMYRPRCAAVSGWWTVYDQPAKESGEGYFLEALLRSDGDSPIFHAASFTYESCPPGFDPTENTVRCCSPGVVLTALFFLLLPLRAPLRCRSILTDLNPDTPRQYKTKTVLISGSLPGGSEKRPSRTFPISGITDLHFLRRLAAEINHQSGDGKITIGYERAA